MIEDGPRTFTGPVRFLGTLGGGYTGVGVKVHNSAAITASDNIAKRLSFDTEDWDTNSMFDTAALDYRITIRTKGIYLVVLNVSWVGNATGERQAMINHHSVYGANKELVGRVREASPGVNIFEVILSALVQCQSLDTLEAWVHQNSGGNLDVDAIANYSPYFSAVKVA